jgi:hypothetical protein
VHAQNAIGAAAQVKEKGVDWAHHLANRASGSTPGIRITGTQGCSMAQRILAIRLHCRLHRIVGADHSVVRTAVLGDSR